MPTADHPRITIRLDPDLHKRLVDEAGAASMPLGRFVRHLLEHTRGPTEADFKRGEELAERFGWP